MLWKSTRSVRSSTREARIEFQQRDSEKLVTRHKHGTLQQPYDAY